MDSGNSEFVNLANFLDGIRTQLEIAHSNRENSQKEQLFDIERVELELRFVVENDNKINGGVNFHVLSMGAHESIKTSNVQQARLVLKINENAKKKNVPGARPHPDGTGSNPSNDVEPL